jgi:hypothetical protein
MATATAIRLLVNTIGFPSFGMVGNADFVFYQTLHRGFDESDRHFATLIFNACDDERRSLSGSMRVPSAGAQQG